MTRTLLKVALPAVAIAAALVTGAWFLWSQSVHGPEPQTTPSRGAARPDLGSATVSRRDQALLAAREALKDQRLMAPAGDNAVEYYLTALGEDSDNVSARQALLELIPPAADAVQSSINVGDLFEAERRLDLLKRMGVSELRLNLVREQLAKAKLDIARQADAEVAAASPPFSPSPAVNPTPTPSAATTADPVPVARTSADQTGNALSATADPAPAPGQQPASAASNPPTPPAPSPAAPILRIVEPRQLVDAAPAYPSVAVQRRLEGQVELEFQVEVDGSVSNIQVVGSEPARVFDREAVRAAQRWRFEPRRENGVAVSSRVRKTLQFRLKSSQ